MSFNSLHGYKPVFTERISLLFEKLHQCRGVFVERLQRGGACAKRLAKEWFFPAEAATAREMSEENVVRARGWVSTRYTVTSPGLPSEYRYFLKSYTSAGEYLSKGYKRCPFRGMRVEGSWTAKG